MAKVVKHAWTHRPRSQGGTDPLPPTDLPWVRAYNQGSAGQTVTATDELEFTTCNGVDLYQVGDANPSGTFSLDPDDPKGVLIARQGLYMAHAEVHYEAADAADVRSMYLAWNFASNGPLASVGSPLRPGIGFQGAPTAINVVTTTSKTTLSNWAIAPLSFSVSVANPFRLAVTLEFSSVSYDIDPDVVSFLTVVRLSDKAAESIDFTP